MLLCKNVLNISGMECPLIFHIAYFLGVNPYSRLISPKFFSCCGLTVLTFNVLIGVSIIYSMIVAKHNAFVVFVVIARVLVNAYFVLESCSSGSVKLPFYEEIILNLDNKTKTKSFFTLDVVCLILSLSTMSEHVIIVARQAFGSILLILGVLVDVLVLLITLTQFCLCCLSINSMYDSLQEDIANFFPCTGTYRRLRIRQLDIINTVREINQVFSLKLLIYNFSVIIILLEKVDFLVARITNKNYDIEFVFVFVSFYGYLTALWFFSYNPWRCGKKVGVVINVSKN